ncbi:hypothetical protein EMIHUDRAFT_124218, partial [Emiliania huxleyi CCMP1516]|uniref:Dipeptidylpeptidase IV N-terminal domain-containing protein n=2 Tax=Emiliania huxleyi TaxID=2903 RepID=A0A0D3IY81_EMIH1
MSAKAARALRAGAGAGAGAGAAGASAGAGAGAVSAGAASAMVTSGAGAGAVSAGAASAMVTSAGTMLAKGTRTSGTRANSSCPARFASHDGDLNRKAESKTSASSAALRCRACRRDLCAEPADVLCAAKPADATSVPSLLDAMLLHLPLIVGCAWTHRTLPIRTHAVSQSATAVADGASNAATRAAVRMAATTSDAIIPKSVLFGNPEYASPIISPDGKLLAYLRPDEGVLNVWCRTVGASDDRVITKDRYRGIRQAFWAEDSKTLLYMQDDGGDENFSSLEHRRDDAIFRRARSDPVSGRKAQNV